VIFGASGDLTRRKLGPALFALHAAGRLAPGCTIVGFARTEWADDDFRSHIRSGIDEFEGGCDDAVWQSFAARLRYLTGDLTTAADYTRLARLLDQVESGVSNRLYYLAVSPQFFGDAISQLGRAGLAGPDGAAGRRHVVIEKPFGHDGASAAALDALVHSVFSESQVFRIDHYLGKETAQNILYFRFANTIFDPLLNRNYVDSVQISVNEDVDVGHRAGYYDSAGVWRDMFQNHLMQLLTLVAMEAPAPYDATQLRNEKVKVLASVQPIAPSDAKARCGTGRN
jgi:glucose-6-phosphate 1-dehydrogenase